MCKAGYVHVITLPSLSRSRSQLFLGPSGLHLPAICFPTQMFHVLPSQGDLSLLASPAEGAEKGEGQRLPPAGHFREILAASVLWTF